MYAPNNMAMKYMKMKNLEEQEKIDKSIFLVGDCSTSLSVINRSSRPKRLRKLMFRTPGLYYCDPTDRFSTLYSLIHSLFPSTLSHLKKVEQILGHKSQF